MSDADGRVYGRGVASTVPLITTDELILDAAEDCFMTVGVRGTTMDAIAAAAGVSRITVYRRVGNRDQIVLAVLLRIVDRYLARLQPRLLAQRSLADALTLLIRSTVRAARRDDLSLLFASEERGATGAPIAGAMPPLAATHTFWLSHTRVCCATDSGASETGCRADDGTSIGGMGTSPCGRRRSATFLSAAE